MPVRSKSKLPFNFATSNSYFGKAASRVLRAYLCGADHPMKLPLWALFRRIVAKRLMVPCGASGWITVDEADLVQREILARGAYEPEVWHSLEAFCADAEVVWDIGAHVGGFTVSALCNSAVAEVHAFEPNPMHRNVLQTNLSLNPSRSISHFCALSDHQHTASLYLGPASNLGLTSLVSRPQSTTCDVECSTVDHLVFEERIPAPTLIKIDVEGWEDSVFKGAQRTLDRYPPKAIVFEAESQPDGNPKEMCSFERLGFDRFTFWRIKRPNSEIDSRENYLAVARARYGSLDRISRHLAESAQIVPVGVHQGVGQVARS